jgi:uncharacterized damage-inducible protein DinB
MEASRLTVLQLLREYSWDKESWFLPLASAIEGITSEEASWRPPGGGNTIWQTLNHLNFYNARILERLKGRAPAPLSVTNTETFGEPGDPNDAAGWQETVRRARQIAEDIREALNGITEAELDNDGLGEALTAWVMHDAYHTGQIVLLRKMQGAWLAERE